MHYLGIFDARAELSWAIPAKTVAIALKGLVILTHVIWILVASKDDNLFHSCFLLQAL